MLLNPMSLFRFCFLLLLLVATGCDRVQDQPKPDLLEELILNDLKLGVAKGGKVAIDIPGHISIPEEAIIRITHQPKNGTITLDALRKLFVFQADSNWNGGFDTARYEVCNSRICKEGRLIFQVTDSCQLDVPDYQFTVPSTVNQLALPSTFGCGGTITQLLNTNPNYFQLQNGTIFTSFPLYENLDLNFNMVICSPTNQCDTALVQVTVQGQLNPCLASFKPQNDLRTILPTFIAFSIHYDSLLANDSACQGDILPASLQVISGPSRGTISYRSNVQGRFLRYNRDSSFVTGTDSLTYRISGSSGAIGQAKVFIKIKN